MSRTPDRTNVWALRESIERLRVIVPQIRQLENALAELEKLREERARICRSIPRALEEMDCRSEGNAGWEARVTVLLMELVEQTREVAEKKHNA